MSDWKFPAVLICAMLLGVAFTYLQQRAYLRELNRVLRENSGDHLMLVSGRGRTWRGGAIVILVVHMLSDQIVVASKLSGFTVFARFRPVPALLGSIEDAVDRISGKPAKTAVQMALAQVRPSGSSAPKASRVLRQRRNPVTT